MTFNDAKEYLKSLLSIDSVEKAPKEGMPFGEGVYECLEKALAILKQEGFRVKNGGGYYGYGEIGEGELFGILTHLDVVPVGKAERGNHSDRLFARRPRSASCGRTLTTCCARHHPRR